MPECVAGLRSGPPRGTLVTMTPTAVRPGRSSVARRLVRLAPVLHPRVVPGLAAVAALTAPAVAAGRLAPVVGAPVFGVLLGVGLSPVARRRPVLAPGVRAAAGPGLQVAVVLLGFQLSVRQVARTGLATLPVLVATLTVCFALAAVAGRRLGIGRDLRTLIGVGTGVCGASAIAATSPVIAAASADVAYAVSTIFLFNVAAVLVFPVIGHALGMGQQSFGVFAGTAVNDTSSVVAAATAYGTPAAHQAVVVKLTRTLAIVPITLVLGAVRGGRERRNPLRSVPWFLVAFLVAAAVNSAGAVPTGAHAPLQRTATLLITAALTAIGLGTDVAGLRRAGLRPLALGLVLWVAVAATSLGVQALTTGL